MKLQFRRLCLHLHRKLFLKKEKGKQASEFPFKIQQGQEEPSNIEGEDPAFLDGRQILKD